MPAVSQCEIDEPGCTGFNAATIARPLTRSVPERIDVSRAIVTLTLPAVSAALRAAPSTCWMRPERIVIVGSLPPRPAGGAPGALSATSTASAPAFCAFLTLITKPQVPRSTSAILPVKSLVIGLQPSDVDGPAASAGSVAITTSAVTPAIVSDAPNDAGPNISNGPFAVTLRTNGSPNCRTFGTSFFTLMPFHETLR